MKLIKTGIIGGSGYGGSELLRILLFHPEVELKLVTANEHAGKRIDAVHPNLAKLTDLAFESMPDPQKLGDLDCVFLGLPHGQAIEIVPSIPRSVKVIDLSGDFRLNDATSFKNFYGREHTAMGTQRQFVYGLTEVNRNQIREATRIANPGCFASALELGLFPLVASGLAKGKIIADMKTGSSGSGAKAAANTHHPKRANSFYAYKTFEHQHQPEVEQLLASVNSSWSTDCQLVFQVHSIPVVRGIFGSIYVTTAEPITSQRLGEVFREFYGKEFFIRLVNGSPDINWVKNTNFVDIGWAANGDTAIVFVALDNLVKGAAGQAVQNMNLMFGVDERTGLILPGSNP
ncbi:MAG TPA: N-acetyl-gamma-glutamyl-phosphate reductase [Blastocatellia bacterium]|nr:N-acetyl-gamma-glutamyl-phosphate reductase [Blastocatellia bacterium]